MEATFSTTSGTGMRQKANTSASNNAPIIGFFSRFLAMRQNIAPILPLLPFATSIKINISGSTKIFSSSAFIAK